ncbi:glycosyltransferase family 4 protein [Aeromonas caviae]
MKVAYLTPSLRKSGPNVVLFNLLSGLSANKNNLICDVYYFKNADNLMPFDSIDNIRVLKVNSLLSLYKSLKGYDVIHSNGIVPDFYAFIFKCLLLFKVKIVTTVHNNVYHDLFYAKGIIASIFLGSIWCFLFSFFDKRTFLSKNAIDYYWFLPFKNKNVIVNNSISFTKNVNKINLRDKYNIPNDCIVLGTCANINRLKNIDLIIKKMTPTGRFFFFVIGEGDYKISLKEMVSDRGLSERIIFIDFTLTPEDYMASFDVFMMPSKNEGFGLTILESIASRTPVICSPLPVFKELFDGIVTFIPDLNDFSLDVIVDAALQSKETTIMEGINMINGKYSIGYMAARVVSIYERMGAAETESNI